MNVYVTHSTSYDYKKLLHFPLKNSSLTNDYNFIFPHQNTTGFTNSLDIIKSVDIVLAEVSFPSTGQGIELGWADLLNTKIGLVCMENKIPSKSLLVFKKTIYKYSDSAELIAAVGKALLKS